LKTIAVRGRPAPASVLCARLRAAPPGVTGQDGTAQAGITAALTATLAVLAAQIKILETQITAQLATHPDARIFTSLPRAGTLRAARLLAEIGDCRSRFPDPPPSPPCTPGSYPPAAANAASSNSPPASPPAPPSACTTPSPASTTET